MTEDYKLVKEKNYHAILEKYKPLISKYYHRMVKVVGIQYEDVNDFIGDFYPELCKAVDAIKFEKIKDPDNFVFYKQLSFYLQNATTHSINRTIKRQNKECQFPEKEELKQHYYDKTDNDLLIDKFNEIYLTKLDDRQREIVDGVLSGEKLYKLGISYGEWNKTKQVLHSLLLY